MGAHTRTHAVQIPLVRLTGMPANQPPTAEGRELVERIHREAVERLAGQELPKREPMTIHHTVLAEALPGDPIFHEWNTYRREVGRLLADGNEGRFVLIKGEAVVGLYDLESKAIEEGDNKFPTQTFLVHQIREKEPVIRIRGYSF